MPPPVSVSISPPVLSFLMLENEKCHYQQEGFLFGEINQKETKSITDNDHQQINISTTIRIDSSTSCPKIHYFYNNIGKIDEEKLKRFFGERFDRIIGWYVYQNRPTTNLTLRYRLIHRQLCELFQKSREFFAFGLLNYDRSSNGSTHTFAQSFYRCTELGWDKLPMVIPNLSDNVNAYRTPEAPSVTFDGILAEIGKREFNKAPLWVINRVQNTVQEHNEALVKEVAEAESRLWVLQREVEEKLKEFKERKLTGVASSSLSIDDKEEVGNTSSTESL
ncbi:unnamed protein product [Phyllotreta striolata]|uniref:BRISC complex subunit Abro1 n=1 Tax=Phyllotreta striolata TaxID=444603 RepID=A0A9N9TK28_PHYSR|nr:unnamed protein product [Phyllotreta striolata]